MQCMHFCARVQEMTLKPTDFKKRNFHFETEGVCVMKSEYTKLQDTMIVLFSMGENLRHCITKTLNVAPLLNREYHMKWYSSTW